MKRPPHPSASSNGRPEESIKDLRKYLGEFVIPAKTRLMRQVLSTKTKDELIDAMLEISHLSDLFDYFKGDIEHHTNGGFLC
jgi:hypothetical protein